MKKRGRPVAGYAVARQIRINAIIKNLTDGTATPAEMAVQYGISERQIRFDIQEALRELSAARFEDAEQYRTILLQRLEGFHTIIANQLEIGLNSNMNAGNIAGLVTTGLKVNDQEAKLLGLYTTKLEVKEEIVQHVEVTTIDAAKIFTLLEQSGAIEAPGSVFELPASDITEVEVPFDSTDSFPLVESDEHGG